MIIEGIKLMFIGMTTVMLFLFLMIFLIELVSRLTRLATVKELEAIRLQRELLARSRREKQAARSAEGDADEDIAAIAAAVTAYETEKLALS